MFPGWTWMTKVVVFVSFPLTMELIHWRCTVNDITLDLPCRLQALLKPCHMKTTVLFLSVADATGCGVTD